MIVRGRRMPCESCAVQFSVFRRKRACSECERYYCSACLRRGGGAMCAPCRVLSTRPLARQTIAHLKVRDLQCFLQRQNVSTRGCVEKEELVTLCVSHVNSSSYRRRGPRSGGSPFSSFKGFTNNINDFLNSAFDLRTSGTQPPAPQQPPPTRGNCFNTSHAHPTTRAPPHGNGVNRDTRFTTRPGGEAQIWVPVPEPEPEPAPAERSPSGSAPAHVDTADCLEVEDLDDAGWEFITRPADPLPNDSDVLLTATEASGAEGGAAGAGAGPGAGPGAWVGAGPGAGPGAGLGAPRTPQRAASELELHRSESAATNTNTDTASLQDEPLMDDPGTPRQITLEQMKQASDLELLNVKQLKELLTRNRVEFRGCLERRDLLERAKMLWRDHAKFKDEIDNLPIEECCKICMAAPLECVLLECGHIAACTACSKQLAECPICRQYVVRAVRFFRS